MTISAMAKVWKNRIKAGTQEFDNCPQRYHEDVLTLMRQDVEDGVITAEQFKELTGVQYAAQ